MSAIPSKSLQEASDVHCDAEHNTWKRDGNASESSVSFPYSGQLFSAEVKKMPRIETHSVEGASETTEVMCSNEMESTQLYRKGENTKLDEEFAKYMKERLWSGNAMYAVLSDEEVKTMGKLWSKEKLLFEKLTNEDVSSLAEFAKRIRKYRVAAKREKSRQRMARARERLRKAAENGDSEAIKKIKKNRKSAKKIAAKHYKRKRGRRPSS